MTTFIKRFLISGILLSFVYLSIHIALGFKKHADRAELPAMKLFALDGRTFNLADLPIGTPKVIMFYSPACGYCEQEAEDLRAHRDSLLETGAEVVFVSEHPVEDMAAFAEQEELDHLSFLQHVHVPPGTFEQTFGSAAVPSTFIYDRDHNLIKYYQGRVKVTAILAHLNR